MVVVGRRDEHGVKSVAQLREHLAVVGKDLRLDERVASPDLGALGVHDTDRRRVGFAQCDEFAAADKSRAVEKRPSPVAAADDCDARLGALCELPRTALAEARTADIEEQKACITMWLLLRTRKSKIAHYI